jgi:hypothetical protein
LWFDRREEFTDPPCEPGRFLNLLLPFIPASAGFTAGSRKGRGNLAFYELTNLGTKK